ncbi:hypothetical protein D3C83_66480 [compost metagenome]
MPAVMPLTVSTAMPAAHSAAISSPPRPKMNGSPPFRRATMVPRRASRTISFSMNACGVDLQPPRFPTSTMRAPART